MNLIAHRGNFQGREKDNENNPRHIDRSLIHGFDAEIDIWFMNDNWYLGHDYPFFQIEMNWLKERQNNLWIHCKNIEAIMRIRETDYKFNFFWHDNDDFAITSKGFIWSHPKNGPVEGTIYVMPEKNDDATFSLKLDGICSDNLISLRL